MTLALSLPATPDLASAPDTAPAATAMAAGAERALPRLRDDLRLYDGPPAADGSPSWTLYDPVRHRYFRLGRTAVELLSRWGCGTGAALLTAVNRGTTCAATQQHLAELLRFLALNGLLQADGSAAVAGLVRQAEAARPGWAQWLVHNYLFFRIPLVRPDRFLLATLPLVRPLFSRGFAAVVVVAGLLGLLLVLRQWETFAHTFLHFFSWQGAAWFGVALVVTKICHELGHAYTARRFGCRIPSMGVAFLVMMPVLYTDTSDAWRLSSRRQRLAIGAAGVATELCLAALATLAWSFLPDGPARSAAFLIATVTWIGTLAINLSPFMRFDGYYLLSDALGVANLQPRAFALARWRLRRLVLGLDEPVPEQVSPGLQRTLIAYAVATWVYRLVLFLAIAAVVYHYFFKLLGIVLFAVEIGYFIAAPVLRELGQWWTRRRRLRPNLNILASLTMLAAAGWAVAVPWNTRVVVPAVMQAADYAVLYPPAPAEVVAVHAVEGQEVEAGAPLFELRSPELDYQIAQTEREIALRQLRILRQAASAEDRDRAAAVQQELASYMAALVGLRGQRDRLVVRAPLAGHVVDLDETVRPGLWVGERYRFGQIIATGSAAIRGYAAGADLDRLNPGAEGWFYPDDPLRPAVPVTVATIDRVDAAVIDLPQLASVYGGPVPVRPERDGRLVPEGSHYRVTLRPRDEAALPAQSIAGTVRIEGPAHSYLDRAWRAVAAVVIRESGF